jgi:hypothetical protein
MHAARSPKEQVMAKDSLESFISGITAAYGPLTTETVEGCRSRLEELAKAPPSEGWLAALHRAPPEDLELHRDHAHGFLLLTHGENAGRYRVPHDHGKGWVIYAVQQGEMEMGTYSRLDSDGAVRLVRRETYRMRAGDCRVYLPGDIHDTRCISESVLMFRFTSCDLKVEGREGRMTRYLENDGIWDAVRR